MVLHKSTFRKFGYWPRHLSNGSDKLVCVRCDLCHAIRNINYYYVNKNKTQYCQPCSAKIVPKQTTKLKNNALWNKYRDTDATPEDAYNLLFNFWWQNLKNCNSPSVYNTVRSPGERVIAKRMGSEESIRLLASIGLHTFPRNTLEMRKATIRYVLKQPEPYRFACANLFMGRYKFRIRGNIMTSSNKYFVALCDSLNFRYKIGGEFHGARMYILSGSFFVDNRWIHVG